MTADPATVPAVTVVIPTRDEAGRVGPLVARLLADGARVVVADGGSVDGTSDMARAAGATVVVCDPGRGSQMNAGASALFAAKPRAADGDDALLFLHADTILPDGWRAEVGRVLATPGVAAGAFAFRLDAAGGAARWIEWGVNLRCRWLHAPYGDQAIFLRRATFDAVGGYRPIPAMEDYDLVRRLRRVGRIVVSPLPAVTSGRRYARRGVARTVLLNRACVIGYHLGVPPATIARWRAAPHPEPPVPPDAPCPKRPCRPSPAASSTT